MTPRTLSAVNVVDFMSRHLPPRQMLLAPILPTQGLMMLYAWRGVGKTQVALGIAYAVASGGTFLKWHAPQPRRVLYLDGEMQAIVMQERIAAIAAASKTAPPAPDYLRIITPDLQGPSALNLATPEGRAAVEEWLSDGCDLIVVDNIATLFGKSRAPWEQKWLLDLRRRNIAVILIHHAGKRGTQRGTSDREDILDTVMLLQRPEDYNPTQGARFQVHLEKSRGLFGDDAAPFEARLENTGEWAVSDIGEQAAALADGCACADPSMPPQKGFWAYRVEMDAQFALQAARTDLVTVIGQRPNKKTLYAIG